MGTHIGYSSRHLGGVAALLVGYAEYMSEKNAPESEAFGPRPKRKASKRHDMKFRVDPVLFAKLGALAEIESRLAKLDDPESGHISDNAQLHHILQVAVEKYELKHGALPASDDETSIQRHVRARSK